VNHQMRPFNEEAFALALKAKPKLVKLALGENEGFSEPHKVPRALRRVPERESPGVFACLLTSKKIL
jgi:hypothetical protein